jgi:hypothetical protein
VSTYLLTNGLSNFKKFEQNVFVQKRLSTFHQRNFEDFISKGSNPHPFLTPSIERSQNSGFLQSVPCGLCTIGNIFGSTAFSFPVVEGTHSSQLRQVLKSVHTLNLHACTQGDQIGRIFAEFSPNFRRIFAHQATVYLG